MDNLQ